MTDPLELPSWPSGVPLPERLRELLRFADSDGGGMFAAIENYGLYRDALISLTDRREAEIFGPLSSTFGFLAKDGSGGHLALSLQSPEPASCPVVLFGSEGQKYVLGDDLDDFLRLLAGRWKDDAHEELHGDDDFRRWVETLGLVPYVECERELERLNIRTVEFLRRFAAEQRKVRTLLRPEQPCVLDVQPGERVGAVHLGSSEAAISRLLGEPRFASWESADNSTMTAFYDGTPYVLTYDRKARTVTHVEIFAEFVVLQFPGGFEPLFASDEESINWLRERDPDFSIDHKTLTSGQLGISMSLDWGYGRYGVDIHTRWVKAISFSKASMCA